jgi:uncharacterized coiled-coil protein SlyX
MKKSTLIAGASMIMLGVPCATMTHAQAARGPFADVPADHWAYESVDNLQKAGIVIGYPDGTYGGKRAMTRYEFAVAIARLLPLLQNNDKYATKDDLAALRKDLEDKLAANQSAINDLRKLVDEFQGELQRLGQDVAAIKERLDALEARVSAVEEEQRRVKFNGWANLIARADAEKTTGTTFMDKNGVDTGKSKHMLQTSDIYHDFVLGVRGKVSGNSSITAKIDFGNYLSALGNTAASPYYPTWGGPASAIMPGQLSAANQDTTIWELKYEAPISLGPLGGAELVAGRFGNQWTKYTLKQVDSDIYTNLYQTDSGDITGDGAKVNFKLGPAHLNAFATKFSAVPYSQPYVGSTYASVGTRPGGEIFDNRAARLTQGVGVRATFGSPESAQLGVSVAEYGLDAPTASGLATDANRLPGIPGSPLGGLQSSYNRLGVYGLDFNGGLPFLRSTGLTLDASWTTSSEATGDSYNNVGNNWMYQQAEAQLGLVLGALSLKGGYQYVGPEFTAPGYWGKVGAWTNPSNVTGGVVSAKYAFGPRLTLNADYQGYKAAYGVTRQGLAINSPLQQGDKLDRFQIGLGYGLSSSYSVDLGYENVQYKLQANPGHGAGTPQEQYINLGLGHSFNDNASFKFLYQIVQYDDKGTGFDPLAAGGKRDGGVAVGQFQLKF